MSSRAKHAPGGQQRMYLHFAAVTLVITALVAIFVEGEKPKALPVVEVTADDIERAALGEPVNAIVTRQSNRRFNEYHGLHRRPSRLSFDDDPGDGWDEPVDEVPSQATLAYSAAGGETLAQTPSVLELPPGLTPEEVRQRIEALLAQKALQAAEMDGELTPSDDVEAQVAALVAGARLRSGAREGGD